MNLVVKMGTKGRSRKRRFKTKGIIASCVHEHLAVQSCLGIQAHGTPVHRSLLLLLQISMSNSKQPCLCLQYCSSCNQTLEQLHRYKPLLHTNCLPTHKKDSHRYYQSYRSSTHQHISSTDPHDRTHKLLYISNNSTPQ